MNYTVSITSQGQLSIPAQIRRELGFNIARKGMVTVQNGKVIIEPIKDLLELKGSLYTAKKPLTTGQLHKILADELIDGRLKNK